MLRQPASLPATQQLLQRLVSVHRPIETTHSPPTRGCPQVWHRGAKVAEHVGASRARLLEVIDSLDSVLLQ